MNRLLASLLHLTLALSTGPVVAQDTGQPTPASESWVSSVWTVTVQGDMRHRTLKVLSSDSLSFNTAQLDALFGWEDKPGKKIVVNVVGAVGSRQLTLTTPSDASVVANEVGPDTYRGTMTTKKGATLTAVLSRQHGADVTAAGAAPDTAAPATPITAAFKASGHDTYLVYMGGNDCPPCRAWRGVELPKLRASPEFAYIKFFFVTKAVPASVPPAMFLPDEVRPFKAILDEASSGAPGSPQTAVIVDGKVYDYFYGARDASDIVRLLHAIRTDIPYPAGRCKKMAGIGRACEIFVK